MALKGSASAGGDHIDAATAKSIAKAEKTVAKSPSDAAARASLASAYLLAGRFESAVTTYEDARFLGDESARTGLSLALAHVGAGDKAAAVALLDEFNGQIPDSDYGLAIALAGETTRGVEILASAMRDGDNSAKLRQNLAYAYALDGRWREARLMAGQDVPADKLDARISEWARQGRPEDYRMRVAAMLSAPVIEDAGQPQYLALSRPPGQEGAAFAVQSEPVGELPPVENGESFWLAEATRPEEQPAAVAVAQPETVPTPAKPATQDFADAFSESTPETSFVSRPVVQTVPERVKVAEAPQRKSRTEAPQRKSRTVAPARGLVPVVKASGSGSHLVQLGSFTSRKNADRAWSIYLSRNPELESFDKTISKAMVGGKTYWRVAAAGFDKGSARQMCSAVKTRGSGCIAYSRDNPLPGAIKD